MPIQTFVAGQAFTAAQANKINTGADGGTYTPSLTSMAIGTGGSALNTAEFTYIGGLLAVEGRIVLGTSGASVSGIPIASLPAGYNIDFATFAVPIGLCFMLDGAVASNAVVRSNSATGVDFTFWNTSQILVATSATAPFTWAAGDAINYHYVVRAVTV